MNRSIPAAPASAPMFGDDFPEVSARVAARRAAESTRERFAAHIASLTFHVDDVPEFGWADVLELLREVLVDEFGWDVVGPFTLGWGDSSTPRYFEVSVHEVAGGMAIVVDEYEAGEAVFSTTFHSAPREATPRALRYLGSLLAG